MSNSLGLVCADDPLGSRIAHLVCEHLQDGPLVGVEILGNGDSELDPEVAVPPSAAQLLHAHARQRYLVACVGAGGDPYVNVPVQGGDPHLSTEQGGCQRDRSRVQDIGSLAAELGVRGNLDEHEQVSTSGPDVLLGCSASRGRVSLPGHP